MNNRAESCERQNDRAAKNILPGRDARLDRGNATEQERGAMPFHRGRTSVVAKDGCEMGASSKVQELAGESPDAAENFSGGGMEAGKAATNVSRIPDRVRACVGWKSGEYDARRLRSQREIIRDVMLSAADCETWLTLGELRALTRYGEASISAQLRHLRRTENGGYDVIKRHREGVCQGGRPGMDGRGECVWEYRITRGMCVDCAGSEARLEAVGA